MQSDHPDGLWALTEWLGQSTRYDLLRVTLGALNITGVVTSVIESCSD